MDNNVKIISCNSIVVRNTDDPTMPFRLDAEFRAPEFMRVAFCMMHGGTESICVRGNTQEALETFVTKNNLFQHPRLIRMAISKPETKETVKTYK
ncbi:MAG: hypothetical protein ABFD50_17930 [Smithella sp.]